MALKTYDQKKLSILVNGTPIVGLDGDSILRIERDVPELYTDYIDNRGFVTRSKNSNNLCTITLTLSQATQSNDILSTFMQLDKASDAGVFALTIQDFNGKSLFFSANAYVVQAPSVEYAKDNKNREWVLKAPDMDIYIGGIQ